MKSTVSRNNYRNIYNGDETVLCKNLTAFKLFTISGSFQIPIKYFYIGNVYNHFTVELETV